MMSFQEKTNNFQNIESADLAKVNKNKFAMEKVLVKDLNRALDPFALINSYSTLFLYLCKIL
jgi:hypothetical protein